LSSLACAMEVSNAGKWKCNTCSLWWPESKDQCQACETWKPSLTEAEIQEKKEAPLKAFLGSSAGAAPKPTGFAGVSSSPSANATTFQFGATDAPFGGGSSGSASLFGNGGQSLFGGGGATGTAPFGGASAAGSTSFVFGAPSPSASSSAFSFGSGQTSSAPVFGMGVTQPSNGAATGAGFVPQTASGSGKPNRNAEPNSQRIKSLQTPQESSGVPTCDVFVFGMGDCDQLGMGEKVTERKKPSPLKVLSGSKITQVCVGAMHNLAITSEGAVFSWGNNDDGALGRPGVENALLPVTSLWGHRIIAGACGDCHSAAVDDRGGVWLWGSYKDSNGYIGFPDFASPGGSVPGDKCKTATQVPGISGAVALAAGDHHTAVLTRNGDLFTWGQNSFGQLGLGQRTGEPPVPKDDSPAEQEVVQKAVAALKGTKRKYLHPQKVTLPAGGGSVKTIGCGGDALFVCMANSGWETYSCGLNGDFQLGLGSQNEGEPTLKKVAALSGVEVTHIGGGQKFSVALDAHGSVWSWGMAPCTALNLPDPVERVKTPRKVPSEYFAELRIRGLKAGGSHVVAWASGGELFTWGFGESHQLGNCPRDVLKFTDEEKDANEGEDEATPYAVSSKALADRVVLGGDAGSNHSVVLAWDGGYASAPPRGTKRNTAFVEPPAKRQRYSAEVLEAARREFALRPRLPPELEALV